MCDKTTHALPNEFTTNALEFVQLAPTRRRLQAAPCTGQPGMHMRHQLRQRRHQPRLQVAVCLERGWGKEMGSEISNFEQRLGCIVFNHRQYDAAGSHAPAVYTVKATAAAAAAAHHHHKPLQPPPYINTTRHQQALHLSSS